MPLLLVASPIIPLQTIQSLSNAQLFSLSRRQFRQEPPRKCGFSRDQGERLVGFYLPPRWKILLDSQPVNYSGFRSWQEMEAWKCNRYDRGSHGLTRAEDQAR
jgi:hypothetical protein